MGVDWYTGCVQNIQKLHGQLCSTAHCDSDMIKNYTHAICYCQDPYQNGCAPPNQDKPGCCSYNLYSPVPILSGNCYCCCSCMANNTPVSYDDANSKAIADYQVGDLVYVADDISLKSWSQQPVKFSSGAGDAGSSNTMIRVTFGEEGSTGYLLVNRAQIFLTAAGQLKTASTLVPGVDELVARDGKATPLVSLEVGTFKLGLHHIATSLTPAKSPNQHLILANGIVCGDWALQTALSTPNVDALPLHPEHATLPEFGTAAYQQAHGHLDHTTTRAAVAGAAPAAAPTAEFAPFGQSPGVYIPENAFSFVTQDQAWEILRKGSQEPPSSDAGKDLLRHLFALFGAFYSDIRFFLDNENQLPNAYFFEEYGQKTLVVTGGLIRMDAVGYEAMALIIARSIGATTGGPPLNDNGLSCAGMADYAGVGGIIPTVWIGLQAGPVITQGIQQVTELFKVVTENRGGSNTCMDPSLDCRLESMQAAYEMLPLPHCAGGSPDPYLAVSGAVGATGTPHGQVTVTFSLPVDTTTAQELGNYAFDPLVDAYSAKVAGDDPTSVVVEADVAAGQAYTLTVNGVLSMEQQPLLYKQSTATFTVPPAGGTS